MGVTGCDGSFRAEVPIGRVVVAVSPSNYEVEWLGLDQEVEVVLRCTPKEVP